MSTGVALGSNLGDRVQFLRRAAAEISALPEVLALRGSAIYETTPWGVDPNAPAQGDYLNAVVIFETTLDPHDLLSELLIIERRAGRERTALRNAPRTLDLDLLFCGDCVRSDPELVLPHPRLAERAFVLFPLCDVAPDWLHPLLGATATTLLARLEKSVFARRCESLIP